MASGSMIYKPSFTMINSNFQVILRLLPQQFERMQCWYYRQERFMKYDVEMASGSMIYTPDFTKISTGVQKLLGRYTHINIYTYAHTDSKMIS
jgi:hypothetical protein